MVVYWVRVSVCGLFVCVEAGTDVLNQKSS